MTSLKCKWTTQIISILRITYFLTWIIIRGEIWITQGIVIVGLELI